MDEWQSPHGKIPFFRITYHRVAVQPTPQEVVTAVDGDDCPGPYADAFEWTVLDMLAAQDRRERVSLTND